ncbi:MAG: glycosyltransferase, partial [Nitrospirota bacterium]
ERGHDVVFAGESPKTEFIRKQGFRVLHLHEPDPKTLFDNIRKGKLRFISDAEVEWMVEADLALFEQVKPDLVLTDGRFSAPISTHIAGLRHAAIVNVSSTEYRALPYIPFFDWIPANLTGENTAFRKGLDSLNLKLEMRIFDNVMSIFKKLSRRHGLKKTVTATNCLTGKDLTLLADIPEYFPTKNLPGNYFYIGPLTWRSPLDPPPWWPPETDGSPLIYMTMGTTGIGGVFRHVHELIEKSDMRAIITTGGQASDIKSVEGKIYVEEYIDGDLATEASDLVVCHGGNGTVYQALQHGKPVVGIPTIADQKFNMRRVEALGVGKALGWKEFFRNPGKLLEPIRTVIEKPSYSANASRLRDVLRAYHPAQSAADIIEQRFRR